MRQSTRKVIQEVIAACRIHERAVSEAIRKTKDFPLATGLPDVEEGLAISATKLEELLKADGDDPRLDKKAIALLLDAKRKADAAVKEAQAEVRKFAANPNGSLKWDWHGTLVRAVSTRDYFAAAIGVARRAVQDGGCAQAALREWCDGQDTSTRVVRTGGRPIHGVFEEIEENNGMKTAIVAVRQIIDFEARLK